MAATVAQRSVDWIVERLALRANGAVAQRTPSLLANTQQQKFSSGCC